ncbi:hypothetical protein TNIN_455751 [Trichonephila inaurata madagascariensis]|uniref:Uncharacterized protein n=1 Tax=Trichonephila inaurata madagascariensis TaxID=2747483 RepID=A0A8X7BQX6_9ARAC|nr:hypothetical protein TNIN_455751 [Trichonephila inaurata madagascariensis]
MEPFRFPFDIHRSNNQRLNNDISSRERRGIRKRGKKGTSAAEENDRVMSIPAHVPKWNVEHSHLCLTAVLHGHSQVYRTRVTSRSKNVSVVAKSEGTKSKRKLKRAASRPGLSLRRFGLD